MLIALLICCLLLLDIFQLHDIGSESQGHRCTADLTKTKRKAKCLGFYEIEGEILTTDNAVRFLFALVLDKYFYLSFKFSSYLD